MSKTVAFGPARLVSSSCRLARASACRRTLAAAALITSGPPGSISGRSVSRPGKRLVTCAVDEDTNGELVPEQSIHELDLAMELAVLREDYGRAAELRDELREAKSAHPIQSLQMALKDSVDDERFEDAAQIRDKLSALLPPPPPITAGRPELAPSCSDEVTEGVRVQVESYYVHEHSCPERGQYFFAYKVIITNQSESVYQLKTRSWIITDANGRIQRVKGPGVVGEQPVLNPGQSFSYTSACPLKTEWGTMMGEYEFYVLNDVTGEWSQTIGVEVGEFGLNLSSNKLEEH